jgi:hypothetical protein
LKGYGKAVRRLLIREDAQGRGDHEIWTSPHASKPFTVPVTIASRHTANKVLKDAGLPKAF